MKRAEKKDQLISSLIIWKTYITGDGRYFAVQGDKMLKFWETKNWSPVRQIYLGDKPPALRFMHYYPYVLFTYKDKIELLDTRDFSSMELVQLEPDYSHPSVFSADEKFFFLSNNGVHIYNMDKKKCVSVVEGWGRNFKVSHNGKYLLVGPYIWEIDRLLKPYRK